MRFIKSCDEIASVVEDRIGDLAGTPAAGEYTGMGADGTPTNQIDLIAENAVLEYLESSSLCGTVISEERGIVHLSDNPGVIYLDPLDGTHNAIAGIPFYALSIGYAINGEMLGGYIRDLAHKETFSAEKGRGAVLNRKEIHVSGTGLLEESTMSLYGRKFDPESILGLGEKIRRWRLVGASALELAYVACGRIDGFVDVRNTLRVIDAVAGILICQEAGGMVTDREGLPPAFSDDVSEGRCLVATNGHVHSKVIEYLRE